MYQLSFWLCGYNVNFGGCKYLTTKIIIRCRSVSGKYTVVTVNSWGDWSISQRHMLLG